MGQLKVKIDGVWYPVVSGRLGVMRFAIGNGAGDFITSSSTFVDVTGMSVTIPAAVGDRIGMRFTGHAFMSAGSAAGMACSFNVSGTGDVRGANAVCRQDVNSANSRAMTWEWIHTVVSGDITAGIVTIKPRVSISTPTLSIRNDASGVSVMVVTNYGPP